MDNTTISSGTVTIDATDASVFAITRTEAITSMSINLPANARGVSVTLVMTSNGSYSIAWPPNTKWAGGTPPTLSSVAGRIDVVTLSTTNNGLSWLGFVGGLDFQ